MKQFKELLTLTQNELGDMLVDWLLNEYNYNVIDHGYIIQGVSEQPNAPVLVAHLDTINTHRNNNETKYSARLSTEEPVGAPKLSDIIFHNDIIMLHPLSNPKLACLGADDRCGVKTILDILDMGFRPHILFTTDEEVGCQGSEKAVNEKLLEEFSEASMLIQVDRGVHEGYWNEMVFYNYDKDSIPEIYDELSKYFKLAKGSYTDVATLGPYLNKPIVNISASYMNEHKRTEFISITAYDKNLEGLSKFLLWLETQDTSSWEYKAKPIPKTVTTYTGGYGNYGYYGIAKPLKGPKRKKLPKNMLTLDNLIKELVPTTPILAHSVFNAYFSKDFMNLDEGIDLLYEAYKKGYICDEMSHFRYILSYGEL
nr:MAG TPA: zinc peptidase-like protein [Caudoviricetes sp.]